MARAAATSHGKNPGGNANHAAKSTNQGTGNGNNQANKTGAANRTAATNSANTFTFGTGSNARGYRAMGYGRGSNNRNYSRRSGYGQSQSNNRAVVSRLRSTHNSLTQVNNSYQGHRVQAMHSITSAIRQLSHRSMAYRGTSLANNTNRMLAMGNRKANAGAGARQNTRMTQAQSDARMSQALRTLQGVNMQLTNQGSNASGHARARGHVQLAMRHVSTALAIR